MTAALRGAARLVGCHAALGGWILANEPNFRGTPSEHTAAKYAAHLEAKYDGDIGALNGAWSTQLERFDQAPTSPLPPDGDDDLDSGARRMWLDWCRFNSDRVTSWLRALRAAVQAVDPCHQCSAKLNTGPNLRLGPLDNGIDRVALLRLMDITGLDSSFNPPSADGHTRAARNGYAMPSYDTRRYTADWVPVAVTLTLLKSVVPGKLVFDSEWHLVTDCCYTPRERYADPGFTSARVWFSALMGQGAHLVWYWGREADGSAGTAAARSFPESMLARAAPFELSPSIHYFLR
eukprot:353674-Prymnesium_polylepis.1